MNKRDFKRFLIKNLKYCANNKFNNKDYDFQAFYENFKRSMQETGSYELPAYYTKSGRPEIYRY
jgi:hypothetical protein